MPKKRLLTLAEERTLLAEERTLTANIRTWLAVIGLLIIIFKFVLSISWWPVVVVFSILILIILVEDMYRLIKLRKLEKKIRKKTGI